MNVIPQPVKDGFVRLVGPIARALVRSGVKPNVVTTVGTLVVLGAAAAFWRGAPHWGGALLLASGLLDILDGQVARQGGLTTTFGAFYDSTLDRVGESAIFGGIALWFQHGGVPAERAPLAVGLSIAALVSSLLVSYTPARAEGLGLEAKGGIAQRAEPFVLLGAPTLFFGAGRDGGLLFWIVVLLDVATTITVLQRVVHVARVSGDPTRAPTAAKRDTLPGRVPQRRGI